MKSKGTEILWHYTSIQNAISILTNREIWATKNDFLNDRYDIEKPLHHFLEYIESKNYTAAFDKTIIESLKNVACENYIAAFFVSSFSAQEDSLPLWEAYTPIGGCAIGFKKMELFNYFNSHDKGEKPRGYYPLLNGLYKVQYTTMNGARAFKDIEKEIDRYYIQHNCNRPTKEAGQNFHTLEMCVARKDQDFSFEEEYRFIFLSKVDNIAASISFNAGKPFIKIQLPPISKCVEKIILSPHETHDLTIRSLNFVKKLISYKENQPCDFDIKQSRCIQYRIPKV